MYASFLYKKEEVELLCQLDSDLHRVHAAKFVRQDTRPINAVKAFLKASPKPPRALFVHQCGKPHSRPAVAKP